MLWVSVTIKLSVLGLYLTSYSIVYICISAYLIDWLICVIYNVELFNPWAG